VIRIKPDEPFPGLVLPASLTRGKAGIIAAEHYPVGADTVRSGTVISFAVSDAVVIKTAEVWYSVVA